jgi:ubiquinone/menaquinone biosynthesis C-methylase UbiE
MQDQDFAYLYELENSFWWFVGMRDITRAMLDPVCQPGVDRQILDAGSGTGGMMSWMKRYAGNGHVTGIDFSATALSFCRQQGHRLLTQATVTALPFADASFDLVTSFDVLVQLPGKGSDERAIGEMLRVLKPGGVLFARVAAYEWLKSDHDVSLATHHRYSRAEIVGKLDQAGFEILRSTYANSLLLPLAMFTRLVLKPIGLSKGSDVKPLPGGLRWMNAPMTTALRTEAAWLKRGETKLGCGLSVICVARKR